MAANIWLIKSEPSTYPWSKLVKDGTTRWDGVRNYTARNNLRAMKIGDLAFFYHSGIGKEIVGVARVSREAYPDPTAPKGEDWSAVDFEPMTALTAPVTLATIKATPSLAGMQLIKLSRMSVAAVTRAEYETIVALSEAKIAATTKTSTPKTRTTTKRATKKSGKK